MSEEQFCNAAQIFSTVSCGVDMMLIEDRDS